MPHERRWSGRSRKLTALLLAVTVVPAATLIWLGVQLLQQDRSLAAQREQEWRQAAAQSIVHSLERSLVASERWLQEDPLPEGTVRVLVSPQGVDVFPRERVLWVNGGSTLPAAEDGRFADAERWEFQGKPDRAVVVYDQAATSPVRTVRAGALVRLARVRRQQRQWDAAIAAYKELASIADVAVAGAPADLQARRALCAVLEDSGRADGARREAIALEADLLAGRWLLDRATWELTASELQRWTSGALRGAADRLLFSHVASGLADAWRDPSLSRSPASVRRIMVTDGTVVTLIARADDRQALFVALAPAVLHAWIGDAVRNQPEANARISLLAPSGQLVAGSAPAEGSNRVRMPAADTNLPWTVVVDADFASPLARELAGRRRLLLVGLAAILLLVGGGGYVLWHLLQRDLAMARLQTDFVAAVSHEFRTPLTSLRHVTELLEESDDLPPDRRKTFYQALGRSTERLHRLVESLLDFSRMEGGRKPYDLRSTDAGLLVGQVVGDFEREMARRGLSVNLRVEPGDLQISADAQALTHALWNLLDNALKYSPDHQVIDVTVRAHEARVAISVRDRGLGIPLHERKDIFQRFVRGQDASRLGIKGTGLGLAMVSHIVRAHGGTIELDSEEGVGSTFTMVLPADAGPRLAKDEEHDTAGSAELTESAHRAR